MPTAPYVPPVPRTQRPGANLPVGQATGPGVQANSLTTSGASPGMREVFSYDAQGNRLRRLVPIDQPQAPAASQAPVSGTGGTGALSGGPSPAGGPTGSGGTPAQNPNQGPIDPVDVVVGRPTLNSFQEHQDAAMAQARRTLDPQFQAAEERFRQDMVNRGLQEGTQAYDRALANFQRGKTDAYGAAQNAALQQGLAAQNQSFQQNFAESQLANALLRAREQNATTLNVANTNAGASLSSADIGRQNFLDQLAFNREGAATSADQWNRQFGFGQQQWADQFGMQQGAQDFGQYTQMRGFDRDTTNMNNNAGNQQFQQLMSMFGAMAPQMQGAGNVDYLSALGLNQNQQNANYQTGVNQANQNNQNWMALASFFLCDEEAKTITGPVDTATCLKIAQAIPVVQFSYNGDPSATQFVGTLAQPFNRALHGTENPLVRIMDLVGVLLGAVKELSQRLDRMEAA